VLIEGAVHHWDENGVEKGREEVVPEVISQVQGYELEFVRAWVDGKFDAKSTGRNLLTMLPRL
jgi:hypothetical protein